ncbi:hypothetical protein A3715_00725 [Oleiphilus sp. HI0009]|uniref:DUF1285 domain-containing protein n=1 Tax=unclassified Oleiphilus TaxID=2631174 RepID=UPI0007C257B7|nr:MULTISPECIES: DUF1285 domain-containing protein [unclassified Oleiphilus]KZX82310.1 hypothetical protein A3715_00725 [Oleiphilus sp. HI0009]MCH2157204.1 DUF1285 domain-containing protein [Oleiphilaceae bacterium]KZY66669.1 hypothetical protein A3738_05745 [Oleiphilus sp. HI0066]KZY73134.1 hypothetical protein A3739_03115 [Oleiphilus sp. HI0067]KZZ59468.1 hypothetical protein A3762_05090 [Oleiphilus sp. HI0125]
MTTQKILPNFASELKDLLALEGKIPPVETWTPSRESELNIVIKRDGSWWYNGDEMTREATVQLFSRILLLDEEDYYLVTPAEKVKITVECLPFVVRLAEVSGEGRDQRVLLSTNVGDTFELSPDHPIALLENSAGEALPVVTVRRNLQALISRQVYYELADYMEESADEADRYGIRSSGHFFKL